MFQDISIEELLALKEKKEIVLVDVRSPSEYKDGTIPGSINIPLFNDEERAEVGTIYKQDSSQAAKNRGLEIFSSKLPHFIKEFQEIEEQKVVFCWRGGMRSRTTATVLGLMDVHVCRLEGGVRTYRKWVMETLETLKIKPEAYVLNGYTGIGKTVILHKLQDEGYPVIDLEGMANHRGSIFGQIGLEPNNQKKFEALLVEHLIELDQSPYLLFEAESKRIGKVILPPFLIEKKEQGIQVFIEMPMEERVRHILEDYHPMLHQKECIEAFSRIRNRIHTPIATQIAAHLEAAEFAEAVSLLLEYYYDPKYQHTADQFPIERRITIKAKDAEDATNQIRSLLREKSSIY